MPESDSTIEIWKPVVGFENYYEVSNYGNIKRILSKQGTRSGRLLRLKVAPNGHYFIVKLSRNCEKHTHYIHQMVMEAFVGPRPDGHWINHKNGIKTDNHWPQNLEYITPKGNQQHASRLGLLSRGEKRESSKLTDDKVREIMLCVGSNKKISEQFNISQTQIRKIRCGLAWRHITGLPVPN